MTPVPVGDSTLGGGVTLAGLTIGNLPLVPAFDPSISDYAVRCSSGDNALQLGVTTSGTADGSVELAIDGSDAGTASQAAPASLVLHENQLLRVRAVDPDNNAANYFVRCLPHDYPQFSVAVQTGVDAPTPGYYLVGNTSVAGTDTPFATILDTHGVPVWYRRSVHGVINLQLLNSTTLAFSKSLGPTYGTAVDGAISQIDLGTGVITPTHTVGVPTDQHEFLVLNSGNTMLLSYGQTAGINLTGLDGLGDNATIADCRIQELTPGGSLAWSWTASEHLDPTTESTFYPQSTINDVLTTDVFHCNSIDIDDAGHVLVSMRHTDAVYLIDKASGRVTAKFGGATANREGGVHIQLPAADTFYRQHDARFRAGGSISLFDDHAPAVGGARGIEYAVDWQAGTATAVWSYANTQSSAAMGSFRRYDDGSNVIGWGMLAGPHPLTFSDVGSDGHPRLEVTFEDGSYTYRALKVSASALSIQALRAGVFDVP